MSNIYDPYIIWDYTNEMPCNKEILNPIGQPLIVTWQENGHIQYRGCKDYEEVEKVYRQNLGRYKVKCVRSVVLDYGEVATLANAERVEKEEKAQREVDEKEYHRLQEKLYPGNTGSYALDKSAY